MGSSDLKNLLSKVKGEEQKSTPQTKEDDTEVNSQSSDPDSTAGNSSEDNAESSEETGSKRVEANDIAITSKSAEQSDAVLEDNSPSSGGQSAERTQKDSSRQKTPAKKRGRKPSPDLGPGRVMSRSGKIIPERKVKAFRMSRKEIARFERVLREISDRYIDLIDDGQAPNVSIQDAEVVRGMISFFDEEIQQGGYSEAVEDLMEKVLAEVESRAGTVEERRQNQ